jgi:hypothetical protein
VSPRRVYELRCRECGDFDYWETVRDARQHGWTPGRGDTDDLCYNCAAKGEQ